MFLLILILNATLFAQTPAVKISPQFLENSCATVMMPFFLEAYKKPDVYETPILDQITDQQLLELYGKIYDAQGKPDGTKAAEFMEFAVPLFKQKLTSAMQLCTTLGAVRAQACKDDLYSEKCDEILSTRADTQALIKDFSVKIKSSVLRTKPGVASGESLLNKPASSGLFTMTGAMVLIGIFVTLIAFYLVLKTVLKKK